MSETAAVIWAVFGLLGAAFVQSEEPPGDNSSLEFHRPRYRVVTVQSEPWVMKSGDGYSGLIIDILNEVANMSGFDYDIYEAPDGKYGSIDYVTGRFNGIIGQLHVVKADIGAAALTVTDARSRVVTFSSPFFETGAQILLLKPVKPRLSFELLFLPFTTEVWCLTLTSFLAMILLFCAIDRINRKGRKEMLNSRDSKKKNAQVVVPTSAKALSSVWYCFTVAILVLYTSNLTCCLAASRSTVGKLPFKTFHQMADQSDISYGGWLGMRLDPNDVLQRRMERFISSKYTQYTTLDEAINKIRSTNGRFAAIVDGHRGKSVVKKNCDLILLSEQLFSIYNSFACPKSPHGERICASISRALTKLREDGTIFSLFKFWFDRDEDTICSDLSEDEFGSRHGQASVSFESMTMGETAPVFVLFLVGVIVTVVILVAEIIGIKTRHKEENATEMGEAGQLNENIQRQPSRTSSNRSTTLVSDEKTL